MRAKLNLDQYCDLSTVTPELSKLVKYKSEHGSPVAYFPAGTEFTGNMALMLCRTGQASPSDKEAMNALGLSETQIASLKLDYEMTAAGVHDKEARELYRAGVIAGYNADGTEKPGPNWEKYQAALAESESEGT